MYIFVIIDDYSKYTWVFFLTHKSDVFEAFEGLVERSQLRTLCSILRRKDQSSTFGTEDLNKKEWLREGIDHLRKWLGFSSMIKIFFISFAPRQSALHVIFVIDVW